MFRRLAAGLCLGSMALFSAPAVALDVFPGKQEVQMGISQDDLVLHKMDDEFYTEAYYFMARGDDGTQIFVHYGFSNAGFGSFTGAVEITIIDADGSIHFEKSQVKSKNITFAPDKLDINYDDTHHLRGTPALYEMDSKGEKVGVNLKVKPLVEGLKFGDGKTYFDGGEQFYALTILAPKAQFSGTVTINGATRPFTGLGYADHAWQNYPAHKMADRLFSVRGFDQNQSASLLVFVTPSGEPLPALVVTQGDQVVLASSKLKVTQHDLQPDPEKSSYTLPSKLTLEGTSNGKPFTGTVTLDKRIQRQDAIKDFSAFERMLIKMFVANPILYRYEGSYSYSAPAVSAPVAGSAVIEAMILRQE